MFYLIRSFLIVLVIYPNQIYIILKYQKYNFHLVNIYNLLWLIIIISLIIIILPMYFVNTYAEENFLSYNQTQIPPLNPLTIQIYLSETCNILIALNSTTDCPTNKFLYDTYDNSYNISGKFINDTYDIHRTKPPLQNNLEYYRYLNYTTIIIDPYRIETTTFTKQLEITHIFKAQNKSNHSEILINLYVDPQCKNAKISAKSFYMFDSLLNYLISECNPLYKPYPTTQPAISKPYPPSQIYSSPNWDYFAWIHWVKLHCTSEFHADSCI